jgi:hypothetical protein
MKKLIVILGLILIAGLTFAQERTVNLSMASNATYYKYTGTTSDVLIPTTRDTIDLVFQYTGSAIVKKIILGSRFDMRTTADTTVAISLFGKETADDTYVQIIASTLSDAVTSNNVVKILSSKPTNAADSLYMDIPNKTYRYYRARYILKGNDSVGTGINLDQAELKIYN